MRIISVFLLVLMVGCGSDVSGMVSVSVDQLSEEQAQLALDATDEALKGTPVITGNTDVNIDCYGGGTVTVEKSKTIERDPFLYDVDKTWTYTACQTHKGVTIDGTVTCMKEVKYSYADGLRIDCLYGGTLSYTGSVMGSCTIDVQYQADFRNHQFSYSGHYCNHPAVWWQRLRHHCH